MAPTRENVDSCRRLLEEQIGVVDDAVRFVSSRNHLSRDMSDELKSRVLLHLATNDYAVLRRWRREGSLLTYLVTVISRVFLDYRNQEWGKAKPPAVARRLGPVALALWRLTHRKRLTFDEAVMTLQSEQGFTATRDELWAIYSRLPVSAGRYFVDVAELEQREQPGGEADVLVRSSEQSDLAGRVELALSDALADLPTEDRLILKMFFFDGLSRAEIARSLHLDQQRLYPRFLSLLSRLHRTLTARGVSRDDIRQIIAAPDLEGGPSVLEAAAKKDHAGPSQAMSAAPAPAQRLRPRVL
ncbi:MAG: sigma-70 family RNA polymerase sigma factor [Vicinamibacterales bacterium]